MLRSGKAIHAKIHEARPEVVAARTPFRIMAKA